MTSELTRYGAARLPDAPASSAVPFTRQSRAIARSDQAAELQARRDFNEARVAVHRAHLEEIVEKALNQARAELTEDVLLHARAVDSLVTSLSAGKPALELSLREIQQAYMTGETQRIIRRGMGM